MTRLEFNNQPLATNRVCGSCAVCCVGPGLDAEADPTRNSPAIAKHPMSPCQFLSKVRTDARRCTIYDRRPLACEKFYCAWMAGFFNDDLKPNKCGLMVSLYPRDKTKDLTTPNDIAVTVFIMDSRKCGTPDDGPLSDVIREITCRGINDLRLVNYRTKKIIHFIDGEIYNGDLLPGRPEELNFITRERIGAYITFDQQETVP